MAIYSDPDTRAVGSPPSGGSWLSDLFKRPGSPTVPGAGGVPLGGASSGAAATTAGSFWSKFAPELISIGTGLLQSGLSARAEGKAAQQQQDAYMRGVQAFQPYHTLGLQSANALAHELGLEGIDLQGALGGAPVSGPAIPREARSRLPQTAPIAAGRTLADLWRQQPDPNATRPRSLPSGSGRRTLSSYRSAT